MGIEKTTNFSAYGVGQPLLGVPLAPIISPRNPTINDKAQVGQVWVSTDNLTAYTLVGIENGEAIWGMQATPIVGDLTVGGTLIVGTGIVVTADGISATGDSYINAGSLTVAQNLNVSEDITAQGDIYAPKFQTNGDPLSNLTVQANYISAGGGLDDVDVAIATKGDGALYLSLMTGSGVSAPVQTNQRYVETTDASDTVLASYILHASETAIYKFFVNGFKSSSDSSVTAEISLGVYADSSDDLFSIGTPIINIFTNSSVAPTVNISVSYDTGTSQIKIIVNGAVGETWRWVATATSVTLL